VKVLLEAGAEVGALNEFGATAAKVAIEHDKRAIAEYIERHDS
jgi:hypothetical protein